MNTDVSALAPEAQQEWIERRGNQLLAQVQELQAENERLKDVVGEGGDLQSETEKRQKAERVSMELRRQLDEAERRISLEQATTADADQAQKAKLEAAQEADQLREQLRRSSAELERLRDVLGEGVDLQHERDRRAAAERERDVVSGRLDEAQRRLALNSGAVSREEDLSNSLAIAQGQLASLETRHAEDEKEIDRLRIVIGEQGDIQSEVDRRVAIERDRDALVAQLDEAKRRLALNADAEGRQDALLKARADADTFARDLSTRLSAADKEIRRLHAVVGEQGEIGSEIERRERAEEGLQTAERLVDELQRKLQRAERMLEASEQPAG